MKLHDFGARPCHHRSASSPGKERTVSSTGVIKFTDTWQLRNGRWQIIAAQDYLIPK
jgi:hypothetical protein